MWTFCLHAARDTSTGSGGGGRSSVVSGSGSVAGGAGGGSHFRCLIACRAGTPVHRWSCGRRSKVCEERIVALFGEQDVVQFDISVRYSVAMAVRDCLQQLFGRAPSLLLRHHVVLRSLQVGQEVTLAFLKHQRNLDAVLIRIEQLADVAVRWECLQHGSLDLARSHPRRRRRSST